MFEYINLFEFPDFLNKYLELDILKRLQKVGYFCGMDYASKDIYDFPIYISRYDHSLTTALLTYKYTKDKKATIAALFHDISTPCFSHVIDYMNKDFEEQESTEEKTEEILFNDLKLKELLKEDDIDVKDIIEFKKYSVVDNNRPKLCADRIDGIILTSIAWTKELRIENIKEIINDIKVYTNEDNELELGFKTTEIALKVIRLNNIINEYCHSNYDTYMMMLLADITKYLLDNNIIIYNNLYTYNEDELINICKNYSLKDNNFKKLLNKFLYIKQNEIPNIEIPNIKNRYIEPLVNNKRIIFK